jgi:hypothetical protein
VYRPSDVLADIEVAGVVALASEIGSQQKVSRFHNLQLRFSRRRPSSREPAHREKTRRGRSQFLAGQGALPVQAGNSPVHMLNRFSTLRVSTLCIRPTSTVKTGVSNVAGMLLLVSPLDCSSSSGDGRHGCCGEARD